MRACRIRSNSPAVDEVEVGGDGEAGSVELFMKSLSMSRERAAALVKGLEKTWSKLIGIEVVDTESVRFLLVPLSTLSAMESLAMKGEER